MKHSTSLLFLFSCIFLYSLADAQPTSQKQLKRTMKWWRAKYHIPGMQCAVLRDFKVVHTIELGNTTFRGKESIGPSSLFLAGNLPQLATTHLLLSAHEEGILSLYSPIEQYLEGFSIRTTFINEDRRPSALQLLTHTGGINRPDYPKNSGISHTSELLRGSDALARKALQNAISPGEKFMYSEGGFALLRSALESVRNKNILSLLHSYAEEHSFEFFTSQSSQYPPNAAIGHIYSRHRKKNPAYFYPNIESRGWWMSAQSIAKWLANSGSSEHKEWIFETVARDDNSGRMSGMVWQTLEGYENIYIIEDRKDGYTTLLIFDPSKGSGMVVLMNAEVPFFLKEAPRAILQKILNKWYQ